MGVTEADLPVVQPLFQRMIWERMKPGEGPDKLARVIDELGKSGQRFHMEGGSWTNDLSWVRGYDHVLKPMEEASAKFFDTVIKPGVPTSDPRYRKALFHLLSAETSCYRYWGEGLWTDYGRELCRRTQEILDKDF